jgi:ATP-binding cassette subfamily F protein 3
MIILKNVALRRGTKVLLDNATVSINPGEKVGLVGRNGAGKSSLFAVAICTKTVAIHSQPVAHGASGAGHAGNRAATEFVVGRPHLAGGTARSGRSRSGEDYMRMAHAYTALNDAGEHDAPARAQALILGLGFTCGAGSAGEQLLRRLAHASATGARADVP